MTGHISDRALDSLLEGSLSEGEELAIEDHARKCARCASRLREWQILFPQIKTFIPTPEHPAFATEPSFAQAAAPPFTPTPRQSSLNVFVPDWSPPPTHRSTSARIAWVLVALLSLGAAYLLVRRFQKPPEESAFLPSGINAATPSSDSSGLGSGISSAIDSAALKEAHDEFLRDSITEALAAQLHPPVTDSAAGAPPGPVVENPPTSATVASRSGDETAAPAPREQDPPRFPFRANPSGAASTTAGSGSTSGNPAATNPASSNPPAPSMALPEQFTRVSLGEAISRLAGTVRLIQGMTPEAVEIAQGTVLPGADPARAVVRVIYNGPEGRIIMDQQRLDRGQGEEPNIAISTTPNGVSVAQWVDRGGFWISLAGKVDQQALLAIANRIR